MDWMDKRNTLLTDAHTWKSLEHVCDDIDDTAPVLAHVRVEHLSTAGEGAGQIGVNHRVPTCVYNTRKAT